MGDLNHAYVVAKYELAKYVVEKVGKGQRLCNCEHSEFWGPQWAEGGIAELMQ